MFEHKILFLLTAWQHSDSQGVFTLGLCVASIAAPYCIHYTRLQDDPPAAKRSGQTRSASIVKDNPVVTLDLKRESLKGIARTTGIVCERLLCVKGIKSRSIG